jgi:hypothetical protein
MSMDQVVPDRIVGAEGQAPEEGGSRFEYL